jgi:hypothetical protein
MAKENKTVWDLLARDDLPTYQRTGPQGKMLDYIDARTVMKVLDKSVGPENWQCEYKDIAGKVYCGIGIKCDYEPYADGTPRTEWVWKWDVGTETTFDEVKGEASDAFKRAAVKWGIGRFLYEK